ncbi:iron-sulfur cluster biosynthesis protein [Actinophytocola sp.]|uniref:iron-sulfur cluster biosynthesis protein n=1 Tax=Actinophytocola sp. TaxID=1872138 RepID=UPI00389AF304
MLAVTEAAAEAISALTAQGGIEDGGLRFAIESETEAQAALALTVESGPVDGDQVVTANDGAHVFLEERAADYLSDKVLDVQAAADGQLEFAVLEQD